MKVTAEQLAGAIGERQMISAVLESMPSTLRIPLVLCDMDELTYEEVAQSLGIGLSAVKMRIKRAREDFRARVREVRSVVAVAGRTMNNGAADPRMDGEEVDPGEPVTRIGRV